MKKKSPIAFNKEIRAWKKRNGLTVQEIVQKINGAHDYATVSMSTAASWFSKPRIPRPYLLRLMENCFPDFPTAEKK